MTILGIDTSLRSSGYGVLSVEGSRMRALEAGRIRNDPKLPLSACLRAIHARVAELIAAGRMTEAQGKYNKKHESMKKNEPDA